ncbi:MAG: TIGR03960 family B12-binding radical SAM protein [Deferribacteraceae bacterium]|jgi:radical SAM family uncharacterized protein/radical SAM-linked protein|nr:TIGR03960 family B12-binding radical SAM protein [Deferribacteraceae bacterium]
MKKDTIDLCGLTENIDFLEFCKVSKPLRYTGGEPFQIKKDPSGLLTFCLAFPDVYEIGMSHTGYRILYKKLNQSSKISAERFFAPWPDVFEAGLTENIMVTLENRIPLKYCDMVGFSIQYELAYPAVLFLLNKAGIPVLSKDRGEDSPVICAGGNPILNPAPLSAFIDVFFMGEMDGELTVVLERAHALKLNGVAREGLLSMLDEYPFTFIPSLNPKKLVKKAIYTGFSKNSLLDIPQPIIPISPIVQDRVTVEIARGCTNGCRYCQAGIIYRPVREREVSDICSFAAELIAVTGYEEVSLLSLDSGDYTRINELLASLSSYFNPKNVSLSLPSLRAETVNPSILEKASGVRKGGFTIAPEAAAQRLRDIINKNITEQEIINAALYAKQAGYNGVKLYFMCGLPYERDEDITEIAELVKKIENAVKGGRRFEITVSVSNFVPKPFTPFETFGQNPLEEFSRKHKLLRDAMKKVRAKLRFHDTFTSVIEAAISRGDESWHPVLLSALKKGFYLEAWGDFFSREKWEELFAKTPFNPSVLAERVYSDVEPLCWDNIDVGVNKLWLQKERRAAAEGATTPDCRKGGCTACGVCDFDEIANTYADIYAADTLLERKAATYKKYIVTYKREGMAVLLSALDSSRVFARLLISAGVEIKYSDGFNPQPRIIFLAPLPVGIGGEKEFFLMEAGKLTKDITERLNQISMEGLEFLSAEEVASFPRTADFRATYHFDGLSFAFLAEKIKNGEAKYNRAGKHGELKTVNLSDYLVSAEDGVITVNITSQGGFHFPEFFRKSAYPLIPRITRKELIYICEPPG